MKGIIIFMILVSLTVTSVSGINIDLLSMKLNDDSSANVTIDFILSDRDNDILQYLPKILYNELIQNFAINNENKGTYEFKAENITSISELNGSKVLLLPGFYFEDYDWRSYQFEAKTDSLEEKLLSSSIRSLISPDFEPDRLEIIWPDGYVFTAENVRYVPNLMKEI